MKTTIRLLAVDALLLGLEVVVLIRLFTHPLVQDGYGGALHAASQTLLGLAASGAALTFAAVTRERNKVQQWFVFSSVLTSVGWLFLFGLASLAV